MASANLHACLAFVLRAEGGNVDRKSDPGGRTSRGITQRVYNAYRQSHPGLHPDVWQAPQSAVEAIYVEQYWQPYCDRLPDGLDLMLFDFSVHSGRSQAVKTLQRALGFEPDAIDGMMGMVTLRAIDAAAPTDLIRIYAESRRAFLRALEHFPTDGRGWLNRVAKLEATAIAMVHTPAPAPEPVDHDALMAEEASPKANPAQVSLPAIAPESGAVVAGGSGSIAGLLQQLQETLQPFAYTIKVVQIGLVLIAIVAFGVTLHGFLHRAKVKEMVG